MLTGLGLGLGNLLYIKAMMDVLHISLSFLHHCITWDWARARQFPLDKSHDGCTSYLFKFPASLHTLRGCGLVFIFRRHPARPNRRVAKCRLPWSTLGRRASEDEGKARSSKFTPLSVSMHTSVYYICMCVYITYVCVCTYISTYEYTHVSVQCSET